MSRLRIGSHMINLQAALGLAALGWPVFPLHEPTTSGCSCGQDCGSRAGKHPRTLNGFYDATSDKDQLRVWWRCWPTANIGVRTGATVDRCLVVIDIDGEFGEQTAKSLALPKTAEARTGRGRHLFFGCDRIIGSSSGRLGPSIDVRGTGGYVVAPPSQHASGTRYSWQQDPSKGIEDLPESVQVALTQPKPVSPNGNEMSHGLVGPSRSELDAALALRLVRSNYGIRKIERLFRLQSSKYRERSASRGIEHADKYMHRTIDNARLFWARSYEPAVIDLARLEVLGPRAGTPAMPRLVLDLTLIESRTPITMTVAPGALLLAIAPEFTRDDLLVADAWRRIKALKGQRLSVVVMSGRVVWAKREG